MAKDLEEALVNIEVQLGGSQQPNYMDLGDHLEYIEELLEEGGGGGTEVVANPDLVGDEDSLAGLQVGDTKYAVKTYLKFPTTWLTSGTTKAFLDTVNADSNAVEGNAYLGELTCSDLPTGLNNVEAIVEIIKSAVGGSKAIHITLTSGNVKPYRWERTYWNNGLGDSGWKSFLVDVTASDVNSTGIASGKVLKANGSGGASWEDDTEGTPVAANPTLEGDEDALNSIAIDGVKYKVEGSGGGGGAAFDRVDSLPSEPEDKFYFKNAEIIQDITPDDLEKQPLPRSGPIKKFFVNAGLSKNDVLDIIRNSEIVPEGSGSGSYTIFTDNNGQNLSTDLDIYYETDENGEFTSAWLQIYGGTVEAIITSDNGSDELERSKIQGDSWTELWNLDNPDEGWLPGFVGDISLDTILVDNGSLGPNLNDKFVDLVYCYQDVTVPKIEIPNRGKLGRIYINNNLAIEQTDSILRTLTFTKFGDTKEVYPIYSSKDFDLATLDLDNLYNCGIGCCFVLKEIETFERESEYSTHDAVKYSIFVSGNNCEFDGEEIGDFYTIYNSTEGWVDFLEEVPINTKFFADFELSNKWDFSDDGGPIVAVGDQNEKLKEIIYITDKIVDNKALNVKLEETWNNVPVLDTGDVSQVLTFINKKEKNIVPNSGNTNELGITFDTSIAANEVFESLSTLDYPFDMYEQTLFTKPLLVASNSEEHRAVVISVIKYADEEDTILMAGICDTETWYFSGEPLPLFEFYEPDSIGGWYVDNVNTVIETLNNAQLTLSLNSTISGTAMNHLFWLELDPASEIDVGSENAKIFNIFKALSNVGSSAWDDADNLNLKLGYKILNKLGIDEQAEKIITVFNSDETEYDSFVYTPGKTWKDILNERHWFAKDGYATIEYNSLYLEKYVNDTENLYISFEYNSLEGGVVTPKTFKAKVKCIDEVFDITEEKLNYLAKNFKYFWYYDDSNGE